MIGDATNIFQGQGTFCSFRAAEALLNSMSTSYIYLSCWKHDKPMAPENFFAVLQNDVEIERKLMEERKILTHVESVPNKMTAINMEEKFYDRIKVYRFGHLPKTSIYRIIKDEQIVSDKVEEWFPEDKKLLLPPPPRQLPSPPSRSSSVTASPPSSTSSSSKPSSPSFSSSSESNHEQPEIQTKLKVLVASDSCCGVSVSNIGDRLIHAVMH